MDERHLHRAASTAPPAARTGAGSHWLRGIIAGGPRPGRRPRRRRGTRPAGDADEAQPQAGRGARRQLQLQRVGAARSTRGRTAAGGPVRGGASATHGRQRPPARRTRTPRPSSAARARASAAPTRSKRRPGCRTAVVTRARGRAVRAIAVVCSGIPNSATRGAAAADPAREGSRSATAGGRDASPPQHGATSVVPAPGGALQTCCRGSIVGGMPGSGPLSTYLHAEVAQRVEHGVGRSCR